MHGTNRTAFKTDLRNVTWNLVNHSPETNSKNKAFFKIFSELYEKHLKDFNIKIPLGTMDKYRIEKIV